MNKATELFDKILVDGEEINLHELDVNNGKINVGEEKNIKVDFVLKNKNEIPSYLFSYVDQLNSVYIPKSVNTIGNSAFANSSVSYIGGDISNITYIGSRAFAYTNVKEIQGFSYIIPSYLSYNINSMFEGTYLNKDFTYTLNSLYSNFIVGETIELGVYNEPLDGSYAL